MIVYPKNWNQDYEKYSIVKKSIDLNITNIIDILVDILNKLKIKHLAYSGGIDSTLLLVLLTECFGYNKIHTYSISSRKNHPDMKYARMGSKKYNSIHHEYIVNPNNKDIDKFLGDNAVRQLYENIPTKEIICGDGIDEFMCGYYKHLGGNSDEYNYFLSRLLPDHLIPLNKLSGKVKVYLPYLNSKLINIFKNISLAKKVDLINRKKIIVKIAEYFNIPKEIIYRNKYGFIDAFRDVDK